MDISTSAVPQATAALNDFSVNHDSIQQVLNYLLEQPYLSAADIAAKENLSLTQMQVIYQKIQTQPIYQRQLHTSDNRDYFDTVNNHFAKNQYTIVFFVGLYCPARCHFCPSVEIHDNGFRELFVFESQTPERKKMALEDFERLFDQLADQQNQGKKINIKISGGLEPFTDTKTIRWILTLARQHNINTTIFTNGMLLKMKKNRTLALMCDNLRISLSTSDDDSFKQAYFGEHKKNKPIITIHQLGDALGQLITERNQSDSNTQVGINTVAGEFNFHELPALVDFIVHKGIDYMEIKGEYFEQKTETWFKQLEQSLEVITAQMVNKKIGRTTINITGSLGRHNFYNRAPSGLCRASDQARHKMFINPFGECTPVHYWAYPNGGKQESNSEFCGALDRKTGLAQVIQQANSMSTLHYSKLNPFELILSLESERQRKDLEYGIPANFNPYLPSDMLHLVK
ncbi:MAG: radical SAM protein [Gammaproteobacteria bacterium]|nr:radical SAM protein [Gammaproteobacteria bacterium]MDH5731770.1 radical SAM protein [Gammaproteobacteria bacterium]